MQIQIRTFFRKYSPHDPYIDKRSSLFQKCADFELTLCSINLFDIFFFLFYKNAELNELIAALTFTGTEKYRHNTSFFLLES